MTNPKNNIYDEFYFERLNAEMEDMPECDFCGWKDNDKSFFTEVNNKLYCSLHIPLLFDHLRP